MLEECPFCHKHFTVEQVSQEQVDSAISTSERIIPRSRYAHSGPADPSSTDYVTYKTTYRCKHCGKEWTKIAEKKLEIPRNYIKAEEDESQVAREEEEAKEEQYDAEQ